MANTENKKKLLTILMESPLYFAIPLRSRLEFINYFSQQAIYPQILKHNEQLIKEKTDRKRKI